MTTSSKTPILEHPGTGEGIIEPARLYARRPRLPERAVLCFFHDVIQDMATAGELTLATRLSGEGPLVEVYTHRSESSPDVAVAFPGIGAPLASTSLEEVIALGVRAVICAGGAGVLDGSIPVGTLMLPKTALRDEGTSYHYQRRGRFSRAAPGALRVLRETCVDAGHRPLTVAAWTTDAPYRETRAQIAKRRAEGCRAVEMEAAALFAVAKFRKVSLAQLLYAGDDVSGETWNHRDWIQQNEIRETMLRIALEAVRRMNVD